MWTQEHRWADIVYGMFARRDFLHPYLGQSDYYDKPLLSYWLVAAVAAVTDLTTWALRLPSALAGLLGLGSIYYLGKHIKSKDMGLLAAWLWLTTFYFLFWARISSADMLNAGGVMFAIAWYFSKRHQSSFLNYTIFFATIALTSLCKGLLGAVIPAIAVMVDISLQRSWRQHLSLQLLAAGIIGLVIYLLPFIASSVSRGHYGEDGLYLVYRENFLRYFEPFDHRGPIYTYLIFLPIYLLPWTIYFLMALQNLPNRWRQLATDERWVVYTLGILFVFFSLSGSRRNYYVIPMVPFAVLMMADYLVSRADWLKLRKRLATYIAVAFFSMFCLINIGPAWFYQYFGDAVFAEKLQKTATAIAPWSTWKIISLDAESKLNFYLRLPVSTPTYNIKGDLRATQTSASLMRAWPFILKPSANTIFITRARYLPLLTSIIPRYEIVSVQAPKWLGSYLDLSDQPVALLSK